jgi:hypothetical protein
MSSERSSAGRGRVRDARDARLAAALRQNMKRRKAQARARKQAEDAGKPHDSAGILREIVSGQPER